MNEEAEWDGEEKNACGWKDIVRVCVGVRTSASEICFGSVRWIARDCMKILMILF